MLFEPFARDQHLVVARLARRVYAAIIAAAFAAHERKAAAAFAAAQASRQEVRRVGLDVAFLLAFEAFFSLPYGESAIDFLPTLERAVPRLVGKKAHLGAILGDPFLLGAFD